MAYPYYNNFGYQYPYAMPQNYNYSGANNDTKTMVWVDGEIGAKAYQMPNGWPPETPIALWSNSDKKIYLKSWNNAGMPNPLQELDYEIKERTNPALLPANISGDTGYATKDDIEQLKKEMHELMNNVSSMAANMNNNNNNNRNRGGN